MDLDEQAVSRIPESHVQPPKKRFFYGWWILLGGAAASALHSGFYFLGVGAFFLPVAESFNASKTALAGAFSLARLESGLLGPLQGYLINRLGSRKVMFMGIGLMGGGFMVLSIVPSLTWFYVVFVLLIAMGASFGFGPPVHATVVNWFVRRRTRALAITLSGTAVGGMIVPLLAWSIRARGWEDTALIAGVAIWVLGFPIAAIMRFRPEPYGYHPDGLPPEAESAIAESLASEVSFTTREALRTAAFWVMGGAFALRMMSSSAVPLHLIAYLEGDVGFSPATAALFLGLIGPAGLAGRLAFGFLGDMLPKRYIMFVAIGLQAASLPVLATVESPWQAVIFLVMFATGHAGGAPIMLSARGEYFGRRNYATISGFMAVLMLAGTVTGPVVAALFSDHLRNGYSVVFFVFGGLAASSALMLLFLKPPTPKRRSVLSHGLPMGPAG
ncbi:MAG: MFS transporter [Dehalococcoidia bacterium]